MRTNVFQLGAGIVWACAALSSATPVSALVLSNASGAYASCASSYTSQGISACGYVFNYQQTINVIGTPCSSGGCTQNNRLWVDQVYSTGRKTTSYVTMCGSSYIYGLGSCAC